MRVRARRRGGHVDVLSGRPTWKELDGQPLARTRWNHGAVATTQQIRLTWQAVVARSNGRARQGVGYIEGAPTCECVTELLSYSRAPDTIGTARSLNWQQPLKSWHLFKGLSKLTLLSNSMRRPEGFQRFVIKHLISISSRRTK